MKHFKIIPLSLILFLQFQLLAAQIQSKAYDFPIRPGTTQWASLDSYEERLAAYNIPEELLINMNTTDLVQTCLNYPEFRLILTRNNLQHGYDYIKSIFNGFSELEARNDAGVELLKQYKKLNPVDFYKHNTPIDRGKFCFEMTCIELLLAQKTILANMEDVVIQELLRIDISNYETIEKMPKEFGTFGLITPALILSRLLVVTGNHDINSGKLEDIKLLMFIRNTDLYDAATLSYIITLSKTMLNKYENE